jgi:type IV pilus assembly protein PilE
MKTSRLQSFGPYVKGFTLIELLITLAIIGILTSLALPSYTNYVRRSKITEATAGLSGMSVKMEQYFQDNRTYVGACTAGTIAPLPSSSHFTFACPTLTATAYTITATGMAGTNMSPFAYSIDQSNTRVTTALPSNWTLPNPSTCWVRREDGSC